MALGGLVGWWISWVAVQDARTLRRGIKATIGRPDDQRVHRKRRRRAGGRPSAFDKAPVPPSQRGRVPN